MRFKSESKSSQMPEVNLVPMMDVVMTILTFFILVSMTLTNQKSLNIALPSANGGGTELKAPDPMIVGLNTQGDILIKSETISEEQLGEQIKSYLASNPQGAVVLTADKKVSYEQLVQLLSKMQKVGGERVSLAIEG